MLPCGLQYMLIYGTGLPHPYDRGSNARGHNTKCCASSAAVKQGAKIAGRVYQAPKNHVGRAPPEQCFTFQGPTRFGAVVLTQIAGFNPKLVRQLSRVSVSSVAAATACRKRVCFRTATAFGQRHHAR